MKLYKLSFIALALTATACTDYLEQEPPSSLTPENFYTSEDQYTTYTTMNIHLSGYRLCPTYA